MATFSSFKAVVLALAAVAVSLVMGFQMLGHEPYIPSGNRLLVIASSVGTAVFAFGVVAALYLIPKANRNVGSFLSAYVLLGVLASFVGCSHWIGKFHGEKKTLENGTGVSVVVPSDWAVATATGGTVDLFVMDWAGTQSVGVTKGGADEAPADAAELERVLASVLEPTPLKNPVADFTCGERCLGKQFVVDSNGTPMRVLFAVKHEGGRWLVLNGGGVESRADKNVPTVIEVMASAR